MATWFIIVVPLSVMHACPTCPAVSSSTAGTNCSIFYFTDTCSFYSVQLTMSKIPTCLFLTHLVSSAYPTLSICISAWNLSESHITYKIIYLLLLSGDIELNAGPCHLDTINFYQLIFILSQTRPLFCKIVLDIVVNILALNETWLQLCDALSFMTFPPSFSRLNEPWLDGSGGGVAFLHKSYWNLACFCLPIPVPKTFESLIATLDSRNRCLA